MRNYTYRAQWSKESRDYVGTCVEFPMESAHAHTAHESIERVHQTITAIVANYLAEEVEPPASLTDRDYGGNFLVRTSPSLHERLMIESAEQGVSLNHWVVQKLADRKPAPSLDPWF